MTRAAENVGGLSREDIDEIKRLMADATGQAMSLRDWFAGQALMGICSNGDLRIGNDPDKVGKAFAGVAYELADLMLLARGDGQ